jgi:hypothetical protein
MALLNNQTIFNLLITLIIGAALYYYIKYKFRVLELTQREHAKVLQSVIMSMNNPRADVQRYNSTNASGMNELPDISEDMNRFNNINGGELINVSDDDGDDSDSEEDDSESGSGSDSGSDSDSDGGSSDGGSDGDDGEHPSNNIDYDSHNTKKIIIGGNVESQMIEHLTGPDVKVIELSHPLYPSHDNGEDDNNDNNDEDDDDDDDDDDDEDSNDDNENDDDNSSNNVNGTEYLEKYKEDDVKNNAASVATEATEVSEVSEVNHANVDDSNFSITAVFKPKESDTNPDLNSMNVQGLRQLLKQRLASDGKQMSETSINKLTKKDLIKQLHQ